MYACVLLIICNVRVIPEPASSHGLQWCLNVYGGHHVTLAHAGLAATQAGQSVSTTPGGRKLSALRGANDDDDDDD